MGVPLLCVRGTLDPEVVALDAASQHDADVGRGAVFYVEGLEEVQVANFERSTFAERGKGLPEVSAARLPATTPTTATTTIANLSS